MWRVVLKRYLIIRRRSLLKTIAAIPVLSTVGAAEQRAWLGLQYSANPFEDWRLIEGRIECRVSGTDRNVFWLTRELSSKGGDFTMRVWLGRIDESCSAGPGWKAIRGSGPPGNSS